MFYLEYIFCETVHYNTDDIIAKCLDIGYIFVMFFSTLMFLKNQLMLDFSSLGFLQELFKTNYKIFKAF